MVFRSLSFFIALLLLGCQSNSKPDSKAVAFDGQKKVLALDTLLLKNWWLKDLEQDSIPGISLDRAYDEILKNQSGEEIIIAVIDTKIDINHKVLKNSIWKNQKEIPENNIDDDGNGFVDDINGWNFLGGANGKSLEIQNIEQVRIVRAYDSIFNSIKATELPNSLIEKFLLYKKAKGSLAASISENNTFLGSIPGFKTTFKNTISSLPIKSKELRINLELLDSLVIEYPDYKDQIDLLKTYYGVGLTDMESFKKEELKYKQYLDYQLNVHYNDRLLQGDDENDLNDVPYGNNKVDTDTDLNGFFRATLVAGPLAVKQFGGNKLMPIVVSTFGDEHDKDLALAIRYAVDNGASVININATKENYSMHKTWVDAAILYAEEKDVLIVHSVGDQFKNIDSDNNAIYPNDTDAKSFESIADNFINVGASTRFLTEDLFANFSNYGSQNVDVLAPGMEIYTTSAKRGSYYEYANGTFMSASIVSGVAGLIRSHYPELSAAQVKQIIMDSGVKFPISVNLSTRRKVEKKIPFNHLTKSGKIVNAYNALLMASQIAKETR